MKLKPLLRSKQLTTVSTTLVVVLKVSISKPSRLLSIEILSSNDAKTKWKVGFSPQTYDEFQATTPKNFPFSKDSNLEPGDEILIEAASTDATSITLDAQVTMLEEKQ